MVRCERCGMGFGPIQAAVLEFCPRCKARDHVSVHLIVPRVKGDLPEGERAG
jgi:protein-arginine kinase activator protein McsA